VRSSDLLLRLLAIAIAVAVFVLVRGERVVTTTFAVSLVARLPPALEPSAPLPADVSVSVSGPWSRLRAIDGGDLGPAVVDLSRAGPGPAAWVVRPEAVHVPRGVRVESIYPAQGSVELRPAPGAEPPP
jgi:hypothetical protein